MSKVLRGKLDMTQEKPDTTLSKDRENVPQRKDGTLPTSTAPSPTPAPGTGKDDVNITDPFRQQSQILKVSKQNYTTIQEDIKQKIRKGKYKIADTNLHSVVSPCLYSSKGTEKSILPLNINTNAPLYRINS
jgi:anti-sigma28 factor (negative regulator of flagellin synthesis)